MANKRQQKARTNIVQTRQQITEAYSGPLPPASQLEHYERILPGMADRVLTMAEGNAKHRQGLEKAVVDGNVAAQARGQRFAFILALLVVAVGAWLVYVGKTTTGLWVILADVVGLAAVFIVGRMIEKSERADKRRALSEGR